MKKRYLILEDGSVFEGKAFGADRANIGELVFHTGMCGYIETLTNPSYYGQIVVQTFPMVGNYGVIEADFQGECCLNGYIVREWCNAPSNFRCEYDLDTFLKARNVPGIYGVDTRQITKIIRDKGVMNAMIADEIPAGLEAVKAYAISGAVEAVTAKEKKTVAAENEQYRVTMIDYGSDTGVLSQQLLDRGCTVTVIPASASADEILADKPDGLVLSGGPGDPSDNLMAVYQLSQLLGKLPIFGVGLGHQLLALADGAETTKLKYGHRGGNQPVKEVDGKRTYITSQAHGYAVVSESLKSGREFLVNANDKSCEGILYEAKNALSVQFCPDTSSGPNDTSFLYDRFISMMGGKN